MPTLPAPSASVQITRGRGLERWDYQSSRIDRRGDTEWSHDADWTTYTLSSRGVAFAYSTKALNVPMSRISSIVRARELSKTSVHTRYARQRARETATFKRLREKRNSGP